MNMRVISSENKECMCCMEEHNVKTVQLEEHNVFKKVPIDYIVEGFYCDAADEVYFNEEQIQENDVRMKDAYRKKTGLLTSEEICAVRSKYGISQRDLCMLLGWGGKTITRYESHQVQDKAHDTILKKLDSDPEWFIHLLVEVKETISEKTYLKYLQMARILFEKNQDTYLRKAIEAMYAPYYNDAMYNGNSQLALDKVVDMIRYFSNSKAVTALYKVKLMKLMWYGDFLSYKKRGVSITGLVYRALPMGAVPIGHDSIIELKGIEYEEVEMGEGTAYRFKETGNHKFSYLSAEEIKTLDTVIEKLGKMSKSEIIAFMHKEPAYLETKPRAIIQFKYAEGLLI